MKYALTITPAISVTDRHKIQDALTAIGYHVTGGGQMMDNSACDISFESPDNVQPIDQTVTEAPGSATSDPVA